MAKLTAAARKSIPKQDFAVPGKAPKSGSYPIEDKSHAQNALARSSGKSVAGKVRAAVEKKYPAMLKNNVKKSVSNIQKKLASHVKGRNSVGF